MGMAMIGAGHSGCPCISAAEEAAPVGRRPHQETLQPGRFLSQGLNFGGKSTLEVLYVSFLSILQLKTGPLRTFYRFPRLLGWVGL